MLFLQNQMSAGVCMFFTYANSSTQKAQIAIILPYSEKKAMNTKLGGKYTLP